MSSGITTEFDALCVVSPASLGGETKDQDRANWSPALGTAVVCDGVSTSPRSREAAEQGVAYSRILFNGNIEQRLGTLCDLLTAQRIEAQDVPGRIPSAKSAAMYAMLEDVVREKMKIAFQTTLVAIAVHVVDEETVLEGVVCGDSGFFAFSGEGELLSSSLDGEDVGFDDPAKVTEKPIYFQPGTRVFVRILHDLSADLSLASQLGINRQHVHNWLVCRPLDLLDASTSKECGQADQGY